MDMLSGSDWEFGLTVLVVVIILTTVLIGAFQGTEIEPNESNEGDSTNISSPSKTQKISTLSDSREGLFLDVVDESEDAGKYTSISVREAGKEKQVYVTYHSVTTESLKIAHNDMSDPDEDWEKWTIDDRGNVGSHSSLEIDENRKAHIAYYDATNNRLKYTLWCLEYNRVKYTEVIDDSGDVGKYTSIELDKVDVPRVSYHDSSQGSLKYAERDNSGWKTFTVAEDGDNLGRHTSLALDSDSEPHISFYDWERRDLKYAERSTGSETKDWEVSTIDEAGGLVGKYTSLELDEEDRAHISCYEWTDGDKRLKYVTNSINDRWMSEEVSRSDPSGTYTSLELYGDGHPVISYHEWGEENLKLAVKEGDEWEVVEIDTEGRVGSHASLDYIGQAETHISYYDQGKGNLRHARYFFKNRTPLAPQSLRTRSEYGDVILQWESPFYDGINAPGDHILGYHVYRSEGDGFEKIDNVTQLSYTDKIEGEEEFDVYEYKITAVNRKGAGDNTSIIKTRARYFSYERSSEKTNEYSVLDGGVLPFSKDEDPASYEIRWDLDYVPDEGPTWEDENFKENMYKKYDDVGLKRVLFEYDNGNGDKRRCLQTAWVLGRFDLTSSYEESGSEERFFHLPQDKSSYENLGGEDSLKNTYILETSGELSFEYIDFEFLGEKERIEEPKSEQNKEVWKNTLSVSDSSEDTDVTVIPYVDNEHRGEVETPLDIPHGLELKNKKEVEIVETPDWFPHLLDSFFGDDLEINNIIDEDHTGWMVEFEIPEVDDEDELRDALGQIDISGSPKLDILDDLERYFGGEYGLDIELFPDREIEFDNNLDFETTLIEFQTDVEDDDLGLDTFEGELGNSYDYAADPEMEISVGINVDLLVKEEGISVSGELEIDAGAGIQIDIPLKSIGFAEVGLTAEVEGEIGVGYDVGALDYVAEKGLSLDPGGDEVSIEFLLNFGGGPYGEVGAGLARVEGKLLLDVIVGVELPSKESKIEHLGRFEVEASAGWGLWSKTEEWKLYGTDDSPSMIRVDGKSAVGKEMFSTDRLATRDYGMNEYVGLSDPNDFGQKRNVGPRADPKLASLDGENAIAVWSELSKDADSGMQSNLFYQEFRNGHWENNAVKVPTEAHIAYDPELVALDDEIALIYKAIEDSPDEFDDLEDLESYYTGDALRGKLWDFEEKWSDLDNLNHSVKDQAITNFDADVDDQGYIHIVYRSGYPSLDIFESPPSEVGNIGVLKQEDEGWEESLEIEENLPQSSSPSIGFVDEYGAVLYTRTVEDEDDGYDEACYNQSVLLPLEDEVRIVEETPNTISHELISEEGEEMVLSWVENHTEIRRKVVEDPGGSWSLSDDNTTVHSGDTVTGLSHHVNETGIYYAFQRGQNAAPTIVESSGGEWSKKRSILSENAYAANQIEPDFLLNDPTIVLVEKQRAIESWHSIHHRFDGSLSDGLVMDQSSEGNTGKLEGDWKREEHDTLKEHDRYGNYVTFEGEESKMIVDHSSTLNITKNTEDFTVTALLNIDDYDDESYLMRKEGSWGVFLKQEELEIVFWDGDEKKIISTGLEFPSGWTFLALRYEDDQMNVTLRAYDSTKSLEKSTETIFLDDIDSLSSSTAPLKLAEASGTLAVDDFRVIERYLPSASIKKINRTSFPNFDEEYSVTTEKVPPYVNYTHSENLAVGKPVEFTAQSQQKDLTFSWFFEEGESRYGKYIEYKFTETGHHTVILEAEDEETGAKTRYEKTLHIIDTNPPQFDVEPEVEKYDKNNSVKIGWDEADGTSEPFRYRIHHLTGEEIEWDHSFWKKSTYNDFIILEDLDPTVQHNIKITVRNEVGLVNKSTEPISFTIEDNLPPKFNGLDETYIVDHSERFVQLGWDEADDPNEPISYNIYHSIDGEMNFEHPLRTTTKTEKQIPTSEIGEHYFAVRAEDDEGNEDSNEKIRMVEVKDTTSPKIQISSHLDGQSVGSSVTLEWNAYDNNSGISYYWVKRDNKNWDQVQKQIYTFRDLPEGQMTLTVKVVDNYNNSASDSVNLSVVNEIKPEIIFSNPSPMDGRTEMSTDIELSVVVEHEYDVDLDVSFYEAEGNTLIGTDEGLSSGETATVEWKGLEHNTTYKWYVIAGDDEFNQSSIIWDFTTSSLAGEGYILEIKIEGDGSVDIEPNLPSYEPGTEVTLIADPDEHSYFLEWTGDYESENEKINFTMNSDKDLIVHFEISEYDLEINVDGDGATEPGEGSNTYEHSEVVKVQAYPEEGWKFSHWEGDVPPSEEEQDTINITIDEDKEITGYFEEKPEERGEDEETTGILSYISLVQIILGVVLVGLIAGTFVAYQRSDVEIDQN